MEKMCGPQGFPQGGSEASSGALCTVERNDMKIVWDEESPGSKCGFVIYYACDLRQTLCYPNTNGRSMRYSFGKSSTL